jgi:hypothetical protein
VELAEFLLTARRDDAREEASQFAEEASLLATSGGYGNVLQQADALKLR